MNKLNPEAFPVIIREFAKQFYENQDYNTLNGWIILACDGSKMDLPATPELVNAFGGSLNLSITDQSQVKKPQAACSVLVDVIHHIVLDACVKPYNTSEIPMLYEHLDYCEELLRGKKVMILCDRYYGSAELFYYCFMHGYHLLVRAKSYMYKKQIADIASDGLIHLEINQQWQKRLKREDIRSYAASCPHMDIRVVKNHFTYSLNGYKHQPDPIVVDATYMTNLSSAEFSKQDVIDLYHIRRWDSETAYFDIKDHLEAERFNSGKYNIVINEMYGKILCFSICGVIFDRTEQIIRDRKVNSSDPLYDYLPNMKYICDSIRLEHKFLQCLLLSSRLTENDKILYLHSFEEHCSRNKVPVRPGRHYKRWHRWMKSAPSVKFRIDGRRNPPIRKCFNTNGYLTVQHA